MLYQGNSGCGKGFRNTQCRSRKGFCLIAGLLILLLSVGPALATKWAKGRVLDFDVTPVIDTGQAPEALAVADFDGDGQLDLIVANALDHNLSIFSGIKGRFNLRRSVDGIFGGLLTGDFNGDNLPDLLVIDGEKSNLQVLLNDGGLELRPQKVLQLEGSLPPSAARNCAIGDFNGDTMLDVAATLITPDGHWQILIAAGTGDGQLSKQLSVALDQPPIALIALDSDRDGVTDLATANLQGISVVRGTRQIQTMTVGNDQKFDGVHGRLIVSADFNGDRQNDIAVVSNEGEFWILNGDGPGSFTLGIIGRERGPVSTALAADFNGDKRADLALIRSTGDVALLLGKGGGTFSPATYFTLSGLNTLAAVTADLNGDRRADLITANTDSDTVSLLFGRSDGFFTSRHLLTDQDVAQLVGNDFDNDGRLDLVMTEQNETGGLKLLRGNGLGSFEIVGGLATLPFPGGITSADIDGDRRPELILSSSSTDRIAIFLSSRSITREQMLVFETGNQRGGPGDIAVGDFDGDRLTDVAVANSNALGGTKDITIFFGFKGNNFTRKESIPLDEVPRNLVAGDFNGDGITDLATETCCPDESLMLLLGTKNGSLRQQRLNVPESSFSGLAVADFNHDGITDISFTDITNEHIVTATLGRDAQPVLTTRTSLDIPFLLRAADINNDGEVDLIVFSRTFAAVMLGLGDGNFRLGPAIRTSAAVQMVLGDFNLDNKTDLIIAGRDYIEPIISQKHKEKVK
jgi:hypothetical protein